MKNLKSIAPLFLIFLSLGAAAQPGPRGRMDERREDIEAMKIAFLTRKLDLTPEEAKTFWPVYNQFTDEIKKIRKDRKERMRDARDEFEKMNDKEVEKVIDSEIIFRQQELDVIKKYHSQFKQVLPMKKVAKLYRAEEDFKRELIDRIRDRRMDDRP